MKKDIEWLKSAIQKNLDFYNDKDEEWQMAKVRAYAKSLDLVNQLDEPEVLSQEWVDKNIVYADVNGKTEAFLNEHSVRNLLVPKQEEQSAKTVADVIADFYKSVERLKEVLGTEVKELEE